MRIIRGIWKSRRINPPQNLPVRPTTDIAKEALFNVLENTLNFETLNVLDLFAGTGNISYEFASRGAKKVTAVEQNFRGVEFIQKTINGLGITQLQVIRADVFLFIKKAQTQYDLIFADPPYDLPQLESVPTQIFEHNLLAEEGLLIMEHSGSHDFSKYPHFSHQRKYGKVHFTFFEKTKE